MYDCIVMYKMYGHCRTGFPHLLHKAAGWCLLRTEATVPHSASAHAVAPVAIGAVTTIHGGAIEAVGGGVGAERWPVGLLDRSGRQRRGYPR